MKAIILKHTYINVNNKLTKVNQNSQEIFFVLHQIEYSRSYYARVLPHGRWGYTTYACMNVCMNVCMSIRFPVPPHKSIEKLLYSGPITEARMLGQKEDCVRVSFHLAVGPPICGGESLCYWAVEEQRPCNDLRKCEVIRYIVCTSMQLYFE